MPFGFHLVLVYLMDTLPSGAPQAGLRPARHYPCFRIWRSSFERQRDFNPPETTCCSARTTSSADFCLAVRLPPGLLSRSRDTRQISWGKLNRLLCTVAESTFCAFDGNGLRSTLPARPALTPYIRFLSIDSHICSMLLSDPTSRW